MLEILLWKISHRADQESRRIADRHYNRQSIGAPQFVPPGRCLVLKRKKALWVTSWPFAQYVLHEWAGAWVNSCFRNEGNVKASDLIVSALAATRWKYPEVPEKGMITFVDRSKVKGHKRRGITEYGYCYKKAGFVHVGESKGGLLCFQIKEADMPEPAIPIGAQAELSLTF